MSIARLIDDYCLENEISSIYAYQLRYAFKRFSKYLSRDADVSDLHSDSVNRWLLSEQERGELGSRSRRNIRTSVITIAKYAKSSVTTENVRRVSVPHQAPKAWTIDEFRDIAKAANELPGSLCNGISRSEYFSAILWFCYETGLRRRDAWNFHQSMLDSNHRAAVTQHKTGRVHVIEITPETHADIIRMSKKLKSLGDKRHAQPLAWPHSSTSTFYYWMGKVREIAGISVGERGRSLQHVRRTGATAVECDEAGGAWQYLGHAGGPRLSWVSYIDPTKAKKSRMPPVTHRHGQGQDDRRIPVYSDHQIASRSDQGSNRTVASHANHQRDQSPKPR